MQVATYIPEQDRPQTERMWAKQGYVVNNGATGEEMWTNGSRKVKSIYFMPDQVHLATAEELETYWRPVRAARSERDKQRRQQKREAMEHAVAPMQRYLDEHKGSSEPLTMAICAAVKSAIRDYKRAHDSIPLYSFFNVVLPEFDVNPIPSESITLDTETTGLSPDNGAEILQLSIINQDGDVLFNEYFKPLFAQSWAQAMAVNHITPEMVADKPCIYDKLPEIIAILQGTGCVIGYNTYFDLSMLAAVGAKRPKETPVVDVMEDFAPIYGEYNEKYGTYKWQKLTVCASYYGYDWGEDTAHDSLADCRATLYCYRKMQELPFKTES